MPSERARRQHLAHWPTAAARAWGLVTQAWGAEKDQLAADMRELVIEASRSLPAAQRQAAEEMLMHELQRLTQQAPSAAHGAPLERRADMALARSMHVRMNTPCVQFV